MVPIDIRRLLLGHPSGSIAVTRAYPTELPVIEEASPSPEQPGRVQARVVRVIDGDTTDVEIDGQLRTVRYLGGDCPEGGGDQAEAATAVIGANKPITEKEAN